MRRLRAADILACVDVLHTAHDRQELVLAEALLIKKLQPSINSQREGEVRVLSIFLTILFARYFLPMLSAYLILKIN